MSETDLKKRTKAFALRILKLVDVLPKTTAGAAKLSAIKQEAHELIAITVASIKTARRNRSSHSALRIPKSTLE
jgi:hypothetical protein